jgi:hypothetical protein
MTDGDQPGSQLHEDPGHDESSMEHPAIFFETLVSDSPIFTLIHDALTREAGDDPSRMEAYEEQLRKLRDEGKTLDWLADRARRAIFGDIEAQAMLTAWLDCRPATPSEPPGAEHADYTHLASVAFEDDAQAESFRRSVEQEVVALRQVVTASVENALLRIQKTDRVGSGRKSTRRTHSSLPRKTPNASSRGTGTPSRAAICSNGTRREASSSCSRSLVYEPSAPKR